MLTLQLLQLELSKTKSCWQSFGKAQCSYFWKLSASKCSCFVLIFYETFLTVNTTRIFNTAIEKYKVMHHGKVSDYIT